MRDQRDRIELALFPAGRPANIDRVEVEILATGNLRWTLWDSRRRLLTVPVPHSDGLTMLQSTAILVAARSQAAQDLHRLGRARGE